jgi:hypothetical protein
MGPELVAFVARVTERLARRLMDAEPGGDA